MAAEAVPRTALLPKLLRSQEFKGGTAWHKLLKFSSSKARIAAQPRGSSRAHRCRTPDAIDAAPDAVRRASLATEQS